MNVLLLGSGGREHALAWKLAQSKLISTLFIAPGNPGTANFGINLSDLSAADFARIDELIAEQNIQMIVVGPEDPLVKGVYDYFTSGDAKNKVPVIGPSQQGAMMEGSKSFAKEFMMRHSIPTAAYKEITFNNLNEGLAHIDNNIGPYVLKADGLAAGKGVLIIDDREEAKVSLREMIEENKFGTASSKVVIEQFLKGIEFSVFVLTDGEHYKILPTAKDYKRIGEGDKGLNTGGMGAVSPVPFVDDELMHKVIERIVEPTVKGLKQDGIVYKGFIYVGLILVDNEPFVIEYNCRMGDPETEVVMPRLKNDLLELLVAVSKGELDKHNIEEDERVAVTVIMASGGYPEDFEKGKLISGLENAGPDTICFHAGTKQTADGLVTNGGRVLALTSYGETIKEAVQQSIAVAEKIRFDKKCFRRDIGYEFY
jgi:phosphoribosylamine---glycine ligase